MSNKDSYMKNNKIRNQNVLVMKNKKKKKIEFIV